MLTIGHSTLSSEVFLRILDENGVRCLADVRTIPKSRHNPQFAAEALRVTLSEHGIGYRWLPALGGLRKPRRELGELNAGWKNAGFRGFADYMQGAEFAHGLRELLAMEDGADGAVAPAAAIMCAEAVPWRCHRSMIADALLVRRRQAEHILFDAHGRSKRQAHRLTSFACVEGERLWYPAPSGSLNFEPDGSSQPSGERSSSQ